MRRKGREWRLLQTIFEEEAGKLVTDGRIENFEPAVQAAANRLKPYPAEQPWWGTWRGLIEDLLRGLTPKARARLLEQGKLIAAGEGDEGAAGPLQLSMFEWTAYRARVLDRSSALDAQQAFVDAVHALVLERGADPLDVTHRLCDYITAGEYQQLYDEHVGGE